MTTQACPECGHHVGLHDEDGCMIATCDCTRPAPDDDGEDS